MNPILSIRHELSVHEFLFLYPQVEDSKSLEEHGYILTPESLKFFIIRLKLNSVIQYNDHFFNGETFTKIDPALIDNALKVQGIYHLQKFPEKLDTFKGTKDELDLLIQNLSVGSYGLLHNMDVQPPKSGEWLIRFMTENGIRSSKIFVYPNRFHFVGISPLIESKVAERLMGAVKFFTEGFQETLIVEKVNQTDSGVLQFESAFTDNHPITDYLKKLDPTLKFNVYLLDNKRVIMTDELPLEYDPLFIDVLKWITYPMTDKTKRFGLEFKRFMDYKMPQTTDQLLWKISLRERETDLCFYGNAPFTRKRYNEKVLYRALAPVEVEQGLGIYYGGFFPSEFNVFPGSYSELSARLKDGYYAIRLSTTTKTHVLNYKTDKGIVHQFLPSIDEASVRNLLQTLKSSFE